MPNWCEGSLKVRGEKENIKKFLLGAFTPIQPAILQILRPDLKAPELKVTEDEWSITLESSGKDGFYVRGTRRNFIENNSIEWEFEKQVLIIENYKAAWGIDSEPLAKLSKEYDIDLKIYGFERGMEFNQDIEIHKGQIIKDNEIKFDDYEWECINPTLGG
ncbi:hypothetical protein V7114_20860 [Neobacillus niacini]|uniref:hypothetical protein n=1 Tax=Neobacillus niacini TaxID=86668 RepID=UPI002FFE6D27